MAVMIRRFEVYAAGILGPWWVRDVNFKYRKVAGPFTDPAIANTEADRLNRENS